MVKSVMTLSCLGQLFRTVKTRIRGEFRWSQRSVKGMAGERSEEKVVQRSLKLPGCLTSNTDILAEY